MAKRQTVRGLHLPTSRLTVLGAALVAALVALAVGAVLAGLDAVF